MEAYFLHGIKNKENGRLRLFISQFGFLIKILSLYLIILRIASYRLGITRYKLRGKRQNSEIKFISLFHLTNFHSDQLFSIS